MAFPPPPAKPPPNDVVEILRENTRVQLRHEKPVDLTPPPNRRLRDYLILMTVVNGFFVASLVLNRGAVATMIFSISGMAVASAGLTWIMFGVMHRY